MASSSSEEDVESSHFGGASASAQGKNINPGSIHHGSMRVEPAPVKVSVPRDGGFAAAAGVNQRLTQELSEQTRAFNLEYDEVHSIRVTLGSTLEESKKHEDVNSIRVTLGSTLEESKEHSDEVVALELQINSISEASNSAQEDIRLTVNPK